LLWPPIIPDIIDVRCHSGLNFGANDEEPERYLIQTIHLHITDRAVQD